MSKRPKEQLLIRLEKEIARRADYRGGFGSRLRRNQAVMREAAADIAKIGRPVQPSAQPDFITPPRADHLARIEGPKQ